MEINEMAYDAAMDKYVSLTGRNNTPSLRDAIQAYVDYPRNPLCKHIFDTSTRGNSRCAKCGMWQADYCPPIKNPSEK